jgi:hypothetical protein
MYARTDLQSLIVFNLSFFLSNSRKRQSKNFRTDAMFVLSNIEKLLTEKTMCVRCACRELPLFVLSALKNKFGWTSAVSHVRLDFPADSAL